MCRQGKAARPVRFVVRCCLLGFVWWVFAGTEPKALLVGVVTVLSAALVSTRLSPARSWRWRWTAMPRFLALFTWYSLAGGVDVASRACRPGLPLAPAMLPFTYRLPPGTARTFFANVVSLSPGTLSADWRGDTLLVHVLSRHAPVQRQLERMESAVGRLFGLALADPSSGVRE